MQHMLPVCSALNKFEGKQLENVSLENILQLDCRIGANRDIIQDVLHTIKPLSKYSGDVPIEKLERCLKVLCNKYGLFCKGFVPDTDANGKHTIWRATMVDKSNLELFEPVFGCTIYETVAKLVILAYYITR